MESDQQDVTLSNIRARLLELTQIGDYDEDPETKRQNDILKYEHEVEDVMIMGMRKTFEKMCRGSSGVVSSKEIRRILEMHGQDVSRDDLSYILETFSEGRSDRYMDFLDFSLHLSNQMRTSDEPLNVIFDTINRDLSGELKRDQILRWTKMMDENVTKSEATLMLKKVWTKEDLRHVLTEREHDSRTDDYYETHKRTSQSSSTAKFVEKKSEVAPAATSDEKKKGEEDVRKNPKYSKYVKLIEMHATREQIQVKLKKDNPELNFKLLEPLFD
jgi:Ca2+-binding EF-hand superfamily protein